MSTTDEVLDAIDHTLDDWAVSGDAMRWTPEPPPQPEAPLASTPRRTVEVVIEIDAQPYMDAIQRAVEAMAAFSASGKLARLAAAFRELGEAMEARRRGPEPLCIDGHEYHRRRKARGRR